MDGEKILEGSIKSASYNMVMQVAFRVITFVLNGLVLHNVDKDILGILNVRLMLLIMTILFVSREAFRRGCMSKTRDHNWPQVINLLWLTVPSVFICSFGFCYIWLYWLELPAEQYVADYKFAVYVFGISCVIESFVEPVYLFSQAFQYVRWRLFVDCVMMFIRVGTLVVTVLYYPAYTIRTMAYGQLVVSSILVTLYWFYFYREFQKKAELVKNKELHKDDPLLALHFDSLRDFLPKKLEGQTFIGYELTALTWGFFKQGILKQVLTEGERYIMTVFAVLSFAEQGVYDVVNNLGSMAARFLFLPIEESSYFYFAQMLSRQVPIEKQPKKEIDQVAGVLNRLLRTLSLLGGIIVVFGYSYSHLLLRLYGGTTLTDGAGPLLMKTHCVAVWLMAINGVTEAYVFAAMSSQQLDKYNGLMVILSCVFLFLSWLLSYAVGSVGFILANCVNMFLRICHSLWFINGQYQNLEVKPLRGLIPTILECSSLVLALVVTATSSWFIYPESVIIHVIIGAISGAVVVGAILYDEPELMRLIVNIVKKRLGKAD
nr:EOG090X04LH [Simocephalus serrulatus]